MTPERHTAISAVGVISRDPAADWDFDLCVFHNAHATVPIEKELLAQHGIRQFQMDFDSMAGRRSRIRTKARIAPDQPAGISN